uniref:Putative diguanylate cyclase/phosphodiesterase (GGDEF & EAL domains) with PAS/PAC sensor(S) and Response Regulator Receiver modulation n=1 Tax=Magnetococcus massalia (strain MO-1) TaxID=451514 RepID=A0A1S7LG28_MAGMO|nr:Putative diguanylate cyclase/phosphodiesterase (GGDEF & EAL domains) with PAS/PAC sensor(S) and Response Regulator Receiver modulation [Candidatus Magnetococcus massalia]
MKLSSQLESSILRSNDKPPCILVVDDDEAIRALLCHFMKKIGWSYVTAEDGKEAIDKSISAHPDIILMDAKMPVMDGFDACKHIKETTATRHIPILIITALDDDQSVNQAYASGASDYVPKPIHWAILRNRVEFLYKMAVAERQLNLTAKVFESTTEGIVVTDDKACVLNVNPAFEQITGYSWQEVVGKSINLLKSGRHDKRFYHRMWQALKQKGLWQGELWNRRKSGEIYPQWLNISAIRAPDETVESYVGVFSDLTRIKESEQNLLYLSGHDSVTDLPNRLLFNDRLNQTLVEAKDEKGNLAILILDLDRFKAINDSMGHDVGDALLRSIAERLRQAIPVTATLARMGGDEFAIILPNLEQSQDAAQQAGEILENISHPIMMESVELSIGASIGITIYPLDGTDTAQLMRNAETAMYHAKKSGRNNFQFYRSELNTASLARILLESNLRNAVEREEFLLFYQPQLNVQTGEFSGMEALIRWLHPDQGMVSPGEFIPLSEETGLIVPMGKWALYEACRQTRLWHEKTGKDLRVSVNLSGIQFRLPDFTDMVIQAIEETGIPPHFLELELTESIAMGDVEETLEKLTILSDYGVLLAIDDFGTGFSSLSYLKKFPINTLKVDQSFVRNCTKDPEDAAIIRGFINLAHSLNLGVIAEGVETEEQQTFLQEASCDEIQGYLYGKPLGVEEFTRFIMADSE